MSDDDDYEYDYSDEEEDYEFEDEDDNEMDWNPSSTEGIASENPNAAPTMPGRCHCSFECGLEMS